MLREKSTSSGRTHSSKNTRGKINSSTFLTEENKPLSSADDEHYDSPQTGEQAWRKLWIFLSSVLIFFATVSILYPYTIQIQLESLHAANLVPRNLHLL